MDKEKDLYIKQKFEEDLLISKKANDVFVNFFANDIKNLKIQEIEEIEKQEEIKDEKVVELNSRRSNIFQRRKLMTAVASFMIIFLAVNAYAATQGYNNIFFIIKKAFSKTQEVTDPNEILEDKDTTISYQSIEIAEELSVQINRLVIKENEAILYLNIQEGETIREYPGIYNVYDITNGTKELIGSQKTNRNKQFPAGIRYDEEIKLQNMKNGTNKIALEILNELEEKLVEFEIDLDKKEINIKEGDYASLQKISEVELKDILSKYCLLNYYDEYNFDSESEKNETLEKLKVGITAGIMKEKEIVKTGKNIEYTFENLKLGLGEIFEGEVNSNINTFDYAHYLNQEGYYALLPESLGLCLEISDINFLNGVYTVEYIYCYPTDIDIEENNIEKIPQYKSSLKFEINSNYEYTKYKIVNLEDIKVEELKNKTTSEIKDKNSNKENTIKNQNNTNTTSSSSINKNNISTDKNINSNYSENTTNNTDIISNEKNPGKSNENIDNYASSMSWSELYTPGLKSRVPSLWNVEVKSNVYTGEEDNLKVATVVKGIATGIDKEKNEIINSNVTITYYMPEMMNYRITLEQYTKQIATKFNALDSGTGYSDGLEMKWREARRFDDPLNEEAQSFFYCHIEETDNGTHTNGYVVQIQSDNVANYKLTNIMNWIFNDIKTTSF